MADQYKDTRPVSSRILRLSAPKLRENFRKLEEVIGEGHEFTTGGAQTGKHVAPTFKSLSEDPSQPTATDEVKLYNKGGIFYSLNSAGNKGAVGFETGTKMLFKQSSAPIGWTFVSEDNDRVLVNTSTEGQGGDTGGSWTIGLSVNGHTLTTSQIPGHNHSGPSHTHSGPNHRHDVSLNTNSTGNHRHRFDCGTSDGSTWWGGIQVGSAHHADKGATSYTGDHSHSVSGNTGYSGTGDTGSSGTGNTSNTGGGGSHSHGLSGDDGSWRPAYSKVITATKD